MVAPSVGALGRPVRWAARARANEGKSSASSVWFSPSGSPRVRENELAAQRRAAPATLQPPQPSASHCAAGSEPSPSCALTLSLSKAWQVRDQYKFDKGYYRRFYNYPRIRVSDMKEFAVLGDFVCAYLRHLGQPVRRVLDIGCGLGFWHDAVARHYPNARYTGVEISDYLCEQYGWIHGSVVDLRARTAFDLVICSDVLQYLSNTAASTAIDNLAILCRGAMYFNLLTKQDWEENCDQERTNDDVYLRSSDWYRRRLRRRFIQAGGGLFISPQSPIVLWELEKLT